MPRTSTKQAEILTFLRQFAKENGYSPSVREICAAVGLKSTASVHYHLNELKRLGLIDMDENKNRAISLADLPMQEPTPNRIPVVGVVTAGLPILAVEHIEGYLPWEGEPDCFALRVRGDSMIGAGILDGDKVVVRPQAASIDLFGFLLYNRHRFPMRAAAAGNLCLLFHVKHSRPAAPFRFRNEMERKSYGTIIPPRSPSLHDRRTVPDHDAAVSRHRISGRHVLRLVCAGRRLRRLHGVVHSCRPQPFLPGAAHDPRHVLSGAQPRGLRRR